MSTEVSVCSRCKGKGRISPLPKMEGMPRYEVCVTCHGTGRIGGEPAIDELLSWLDETLKMAEKVTIEKRSPVMLAAVRAILEQHEKLCATAERIKLDAIRAFVERVKLRIDRSAHTSSTGKSNWGVLDAMLDELTAMEKESNEPSTHSPH